MAVTPLCVQDDVEFVWSEFGLVTRVDDDYNGTADTGLVASGIEKATVDVLQYLSRFSLATVTASTWVKWAVAYIAAGAIARRRGMDCPDGLLALIEDYLLKLQAIKDGGVLVLDDGTVAPPRLDGAGPVVTNYTIDGRRKRTKVRRVPASSTGEAPAGKHADIQDYGSYN